MVVITIGFFATISATFSRREKGDIHRDMKFTPSKSLKFARALRQNETSAEARLWGYLRDRRLQGHKFVRQKPIGKFIADFVCFECKLIVEVDGATHGDAYEVAYDLRREAYLRGEGYEIYRCGNEDVYMNLEGVLDGILMQLEARLLGRDGWCGGGERRFAPRSPPVSPVGDPPSPLREEGEGRGSFVRVLRLGLRLRCNRHPRFSGGQRRGGMMGHRFCRPR
jgi:very-short-patch-repair endonuclease